MEVGRWTKPTVAQNTAIPAEYNVEEAADLIACCSPLLVSWYCEQSQVQPIHLKLSPWHMAVLLYCQCVFDYTMVEPDEMENKADIMTEFEFAMNQMVVYTSAVNGHFCCSICKKWNGTDYRAEQVKQMQRDRYNNNTFTYSLSSDDDSSDDEDTTMKDNFLDKYHLDVPPVVAQNSVHHPGLACPACFAPIQQHAIQWFEETVKPLKEKSISLMYPDASMPRPFLNPLLIMSAWIMWMHVNSMSYHNMGYLDKDQQSVRKSVVAWREILLLANPQNVTSMCGIFSSIYIIASTVPNDIQIFAGKSWLYLHVDSETSTQHHEHQQQIVTHPSMPDRVAYLHTQIGLFHFVCDLTDSPQLQPFANMQSSQVPVTKTSNLNYTHFVIANERALFKK